MKIRIQRGNLEKFRCDFLVVKWVQGQKMDGSTGAVDRALGGLLSRMIKEEKFQGREGEMMILPILHHKIPVRKLLVLGLGEQKKVTIDLLRRSAARMVQEARRCHAKRVGVVFLGTGEATIDSYNAAKAMTEGALLGGYLYTKYRSKESSKDVEFPREFVIVTEGTHERSRESFQEKFKNAQRGIRDGEVYAAGEIFARDLVNEPASTMVPKDLAEVAVAIAKRFPSVIEAKIYERPWIEKMGMGSYLGVAKGSDHLPYFIHVIYRPGAVKGKGKRAKGFKKVAIVGKGITFDSGGLSLKPSSAMETMKNDMAGCAAVLGIFSALPKLKPSLEVHGISAVCENMPSGRALKPGDIVRSMNGKTIEVLNTDAEGRLTLADSLPYAARLKPGAIIDLATLTGACIVALGEEYAGYMGNDEALLEQVKEAAARSGERMWPLPLAEEYCEFIKGHMTDYTNITPGKKGAGTITAGLFLKEFVGKVPWVHIDIAGPAWAEREVIPYMPKGGTGFAVRTMLELLKHFSNEKK